MTFKLTATITHKSFSVPVVKELFFSGDTFSDILDKIRGEQVPENHIHNLKFYKRTAFKDVRGVKHLWKLEELVD